jgi:hypothetical protein
VGGAVAHRIVVVAASLDRAAITSLAHIIASRVTTRGKIAVAVRTNKGRGRLGGDSRRARRSHTRRVIDALANAAH